MSAATSSTQAASFGWDVRAVSDCVVVMVEPSLRCRFAAAIGGVQVATGPWGLGGPAAEALIHTNDGSRPLPRRARQGAQFRARITAGVTWIASWSVGESRVRGSCAGY
ncbi:hypothetical protein GCM10025862_31530 [Arsenicicoccus piscis]|uniref:Uncharacterized protein n=1 Tax=Arsenicicoccus piscis TaxID=673954 RepID=A0ABQ6HS08_9MICO|nr:hypothetical protein GCM10025862_31530 [Arsenicicoccus piscis]